MKKGYTLIEVIITLSIIAILTSMISLGANYYRKTTDKMKNEAILAELKSFLSFAKSYCREKNNPGEIHIDQDGKYLTFNVLRKQIKSINFYDDYIIGGNFNSQIIDINSNGFITKFGTLTMYKNREVIGVTTIAVSIDTIRVYETDIITIYKGNKEDEEQ